MSMFERLGEKVEQFKREAVAAREESAEYRCRDCGNGVYSERETCPDCGSAEIGRVATDEASNAAAETGTETQTETSTDPESEPDPE